MNFARKTEQFCEKNSDISQKTESTGGLDPEIFQNFGEKRKPGLDEKAAGNGRAKLNPWKEIQI